MTKEELVKLLKEGLTIEFETHNDLDGKGYNAVIKFEGEEVCSNSFVTKEENYYG